MLKIFGYKRTELNNASILYKTIFPEDIKEILESHVEKKIEFRVITKNGKKFSASSPLGKSTGKYEEKTYKKNLEEDTVGAQKFATVIIIESIMQEISPEDMDKVSRGALPAIVALPGLYGSHGAGVTKLKRLAEKAIGADILG